MKHICNSYLNLDRELHLCKKGYSLFLAATATDCAQYQNRPEFRYNFKRKHYTELQEFVATREVTFIVGPRKCGKTVCMRQFAYEHQNAEYIDVKEVIDKAALVRDIKYAILSSENKTFLIDEVTYFDNPAENIQQIITCFDEVNSPTHIVFSGSQSVALEVWANRSFAGNAGIMRMDFIDYSEWLVYKGLEVSEDSYFDFILNTESFYKFGTCEQYLAGCLNETIISNHKSLEIIPLNECDKLSADILMTVLYAILFSKHNHISYTQFVNRKRLENDLSLYVETDSLKGNITELLNTLEINYDLFSMLSAEVIKQAIVFLYKCGLISVARVTSSLEHYEDPLYVFLQEYIPLNKSRLFVDYNFSIKYPMFYVAILKSLKISAEVVIKNRELLGSLVECHIKGLMSDRFCVEYHTEAGDEIDCIDLKRHIAIESSVSDKHNYSALLELALPRFRKVLTTRTKTESLEDIQRIPYYQWIYELSS